MTASERAANAVVLMMAAMHAQSSNWKACKIHLRTYSLNTGWLLDDTGFTERTGHVGVSWVMNGWTLCRQKGGHLLDMNI